MDAVKKHSYKVVVVLEGCAGIDEGNIAKCIEQWKSEGVTVVDTVDEYFKLMSTWRASRSQRCAGSVALFCLSIYLLMLFSNTLRVSENNIRSQNRLFQIVVTIDQLYLYICRYLRTFCMNSEQVCHRSIISECKKIFKRYYTVILHSFATLQNCKHLTCPLSSSMRCVVVERNFIDLWSYSCTSTTYL